MYTRITYTGQKPSYSGGMNSLDRILGGSAGESESRYEIGKASLWTAPSRHTEDLVVKLIDLQIPRPFTCHWKNHRLTSPISFQSHLVLTVFINEIF
jgi:hypothetical protein